MPDREKVIKGLECCDCDLDHAYFNSCFKCPYEEDNQCGGMGLCTSLLAHDALALLKEQEPVVHCKDCVKRGYDNCPFNEFSMYTPEDNFYCGEGAVKWDAT